MVLPTEGGAARVPPNRATVPAPSPGAGHAALAELSGARAAGLSDAKLAPARDFQRKAQFFLDFIEAENSTGFHAPQEAARILAESINYSRQGQVALRRLPAR